MVLYLGHCSIVHPSCSHVHSIIVNFIVTPGVAIFLSKFWRVGYISNMSKSSLKSFREAQVFIRTFPGMIHQDDKTFEHYPLLLMIKCSMCEDIQGLPLKKTNKKKQSWIYRGQNLCFQVSSRVLRDSRDATYDYYYYFHYSLSLCLLNVRKQMWKMPVIMC